MTQLICKTSRHLSTFFPPPLSTYNPKTSFFPSSHSHTAQPISRAHMTQILQIRYTVYLSVCSQCFSAHFPHLPNVIFLFFFVLHKFTQETSIVHIRLCVSARSEDYKLRQRYTHTHTHVYIFYDRTRCLIMAKRCCNVAWIWVGGELAATAGGGGWRVDPSGRRC